MEKDNLALLADELIQLMMKSSKVVPMEKPMLIGSVWTQKMFNLDIFRAQFKSIWKTKKKFDIRLAGQNLFLISFDCEEDLEFV